MLILQVSNNGEAGEQKLAGKLYFIGHLKSL